MLPFHGRHTGSNPVPTTTSRDRAEVAHKAHNLGVGGSIPSPATNGDLAQLARASDLHSEGQRFDSVILHTISHKRIGIALLQLNKMQVVDSSERRAT